MIPDLAQSLGGYDLRHLEIIAELWGIELAAPDFEQGLSELVPQLLTPALLAETFEILPEASRRALSELQKSRGQMGWALFTRRYGEVRQMGRGRRERELPYRASPSPAETLWYRGLVGRAFFDTPAGPEEFAYIPRDLQPVLAALARPEIGKGGPHGRIAHQDQHSKVSLADDRILDHACTLLAGLKLGLDESHITVHLPLPFRPMCDFLAAAGLVDGTNLPMPEETGNFLKLDRGEGLATLNRAWRASQEYRELRHMPDLLLEGEWAYDPRRGREAVLSFISRLPQDTWWALDAFIDAIRQEDPDFQRPAGDYDSWFIRHSQRGNYLRGFEHWDDVDGAYIRYLLTGPLHWLGVLDLGSAVEAGTPESFRLSRWSADLLAGRAPAGLLEEKDLVAIRSDGRVTVPRLAPRTIRYQVARFCAWEEFKGGKFLYRMTGGSLEKAREQGLRAAPILALLAKSAGAVPPNIARALDHWERGGAGGHLEQVAVLRLASPEILTALRKSRASRFLGDPLSPTAVIVRRGAEKKVLEALVELGYFGLEG